MKENRKEEKIQRDEKGKTRETKGKVQYSEGQKNALQRGWSTRWVRSQGPSKMRTTRDNWTESYGGPWWPQQEGKEEVGSRDGKSHSPSVSFPLNKKDTESRKGNLGWGR